MNFQEKIEIYKDIIVSLDYCINDYLYILDVENDEYFISPHAAVRFKMDNAYFKNPVKEFKKFIYYKDYDLVIEDLNKILSGEKTYHNMQYRWLNDESLPVWINCRGQVIIENHQVKYLIGCINEIGKKQYIGFFAIRQILYRAERRRSPDPEIIYRKKRENHSNFL